MPRWAFPVVVAALVTALIVAGSVAVVQTTRLHSVQDDRDDLAQQVVRLEARVERLEEELAEVAGKEPTRNLLDGLPGELGGLIEGLLEGDLAEFLEGDLVELFEGAGGPVVGVQGAECYLPDAGGFESLLEGLLGTDAEVDGQGGTDLGEHDLDQLVQTTATEVAKIRELGWEEQVEVAFLDDRATFARMEEILSDSVDPDRVDADERLLVALGVLPAGTDLWELQMQILGDTVAGFYVPETEELVVRAPDEGAPGAVDVITLAHELNHALTDQVLGLPDRTDPLYQDDPDRSLAALAVIEGDATIVMNRWALTNLSLTDQVALAMDPALREAEHAFADVPHLLTRELLSPYTDGAGWVCQRLLAGGWGAVDAAYTDPPTTTAELLWGDPIEPAPTPSILTPSGYDKVRTTTLGAASLMWLFEAPGDDVEEALSDPEGRAQAWAGGHATVFEDDQRSAVGLAFIDGGTGSASLCDSMDAWYAAAWGGQRSTPDVGRVVYDQQGRSSVLVCEGDEVVLAIAEDVVTATQMIG